MKSFFIFILITCVFYISSNDYDDEVNFFKQYCNDVNNGIYPDYKRLKHKCDK